MEADYALSSYRFALPEKSIAQTPPAVRGTSRLMVLGRETGPPQHALFADLAHYLPPQCLLVANNSRVVPARLFGNRATGGRVELLLLTPLPLVQPQTCPPAAAPENSGGWQQARVEGLLRSSKKVGQGETVRFSPRLYATLQERGEYGHTVLILYWQGALLEAVNQAGVLPLPPYIKRPQSSAAQEKTEAATASPEQNAPPLTGLDAERYQTTYARADKAGSVAAPTAGLHFTHESRTALEAAGHEWAEVTLYVGYGTFSPVRCQDIRQHPMHSEYAELSAASAAAINRAKAQGRPIIAVGTTATRVLEGVWLAQHGPEKTDNAPLGPHQGWVNTFLYPGKQFHVIDGLVTNFHLPESSLLMLVAALVGRERMLEAYREAVEAGYRFFSYGDAMFVQP